MPRYLYKFLPVSSYSYEAVALKKAWFSSPRLLNDPYDGQVPIVTKVEKDEAFTLAAQMIQGVSRWTGGRLPFNPDAPNFQAGFGRFVSDWLETFAVQGIHSMTEKVDHLLLWAH